MKGRYLIFTPAESIRDEKHFDAAWRRFAELCRSLHRDGLSYEVEFNLTHLKPHTLIVASGTAKQRCRDRALEAEWFLPENRERRKDGTAYWRKHQARYEELSKMAEDFIRADSEYWRELELLSGQREHFKPGRTDETAGADDEAAA